MLFSFFLTALFAGSTFATPIVYDGRAPLTLTEQDIDSSKGPYLSAVKGSQNASHYSKLLGLSTTPTPLWVVAGHLPVEQAVSISIDNTSIFVPGGATGVPQNGFRRTELIAQVNGSSSGLDASSEVGTTVYHFSILQDTKRLLNFSHEYQIVFIEPSDGTHVFGIQLGSPFTNPTGTLPAANAHSFKVLDHALNVLFSTPFTANTWHNFGVQVNWDNRTLGVFYSQNGQTLKAVTGVEPNLSATAGSAGQGDFHFGVLKLPIVNPADSAANQGDVVHFGIQEGTTEALVYSGVFVEKVTNGVSAGNGRTIKAIA